MINIESDNSTGVIIKNRVETTQCDWMKEADAGTSNKLIKGFLTGLGSSLSKPTGSLATSRRRSRKEGTVGKIYVVGLFAGINT